jgi:hypothetical protein
MTVDLCSRESVIEFVKECFMDAFNRGAEFEKVTWYEHWCNWKISLKDGIVGIILVCDRNDVTAFVYPNSENVTSKKDIVLTFLRTYISLFNEKDDLIKYDDLKYGRGQLNPIVSISGKAEFYERYHDQIVSLFKLVPFSKEVRDHILRHESLKGH